MKAEDRCAVPYCRERVAVIVQYLGKAFCAKHEDERVERLTQEARARLIAEGKLKEASP